MLIQKANFSHVEELVQLYDALNDYLATTVNYPGWLKGIYPVRETALQGLEEDSLFIVTEEDVIVGSVILNHTPEDAYIPVKWQADLVYTEILVLRTLVVHPSAFKKNVGTKLLEFAREYAIQEKMKAIRLDVSENNYPAIHLYEKMGFQYIATVDLGLPYEHLKWFRLYELIL